MKKKEWHSYDDIRCPYCNSGDWEQNYVDWADEESGVISAHCNECGKDFTIYVKVLYREVK